MRFSSGDVVDGLCVRDQDFRCRCCSALKESLEQPSPSLAKRHEREARGGRLMLIMLDALGSLSSEQMAENRISWHHFISSLQTAPQAAGRRAVRGGDSFSLAREWFSLALKPVGVTSSLKSHHVGQD